MENKKVSSAGDRHRGVITRAFQKAASRAARMNFTELKWLGDSVALPTAFIAWLTPHTIPEAATLAALVYTALRIAELLVRWIYRLFVMWLAWRKR